MEKQYGTTGKYICNEPMYAYEAVWQVQWTIFLRFGVSASDKMKENAG